jgi:hypothetical protein
MSSRRASGGDTGDMVVPERYAARLVVRFHRFADMFILIVGCRERGCPGGGVAVRLGILVGGSWWPWFPLGAAVAGVR